MHPDEFPVDEELAHRLLAEQFPELAELPLERVLPAGTDNAIFRLGEELALRLPRIDGRLRAGGKEREWLPRLAPLLPLETHLPVAEGRPSGDYPWYWDVYTWVDGDTRDVVDIDPVQAARDLAAFIKALRRVDPAGAPQGRGVPLAERDRYVRAWLRDLGDDGRLAAEWDRALAVPPWAGAPVWHHGDLDARNWLVRDGRIAAVIDWSCMGVGDPACDVMVAWKLSSAAGRATLRDELDVDDETWARARGWALSQGIGATAYYNLANNRVLLVEGRRWIADVFHDVPVTLADYDPAWPVTYAWLEASIREALGPRALRVEHVGSTSVPGLPAKPRIDVLLAVADSSDEAAYVPALEDAGYVLRIREPEWHEHRVLCRADADVNLHVFTVGSTEIDRMLRFRDHLRRDEGDRSLYERAKRDLARRSWRITQDYADAKSAVVEEILTRASE